MDFASLEMTDNLAVGRHAVSDAGRQLTARKMQTLYSSNQQLHGTQRPFILSTTAPSDMAIAVWKMSQPFQPSCDTSCVSQE